MKILMVKRPSNSPRLGGLTLSGNLITNTLSAEGVQVYPHPDDRPVTVLPPVDLIWIYGEFQRVEECLPIAKSRGIPVLFNSTFDGTEKRALWIRKQLAGAGPNLFAGVFAHNTEFDDIWEGSQQVVAIPKLIQRPAHEGLPFKDRSGICIGDLTKVLRPRLGRGGDTLIKRLVGLGLPVYTVIQYGTPTQIPEGVTAVMRGSQDKLSEMLGDVRLFVQGPRYCTFEMMPLEAQAVGTPVAYPHMPQSLTQYIGHSGFLYRNLDEMVDFIKEIYHNQTKWEAWSRMSLANVASYHPDMLGPSLIMTLQGIINRYRRTRGQS